MWNSRSGSRLAPMLDTTRFSLSQNCYVFPGLERHNCVLQRTSLRSAAEDAFRYVDDLLCAAGQLS
jgi:hypothetical protein